MFWGAEMRFAGAEKCIFVILTRSDFGVWALQGVSRLSLVWQGSGTESHGSLWALATGSRLVDRARVRRICGFWKHCLHRAFSLARRPSAFSEPWQTHLLWERCVSLGTCSIAFCVAHAGVRLGGPEKRTGPLHVMVPLGAGFRVYRLEKRMFAGVRLGVCKKRTGSLRVMVPPGAGSGLIRARKTRSCRGRPEENTGSLRVLVPPGAGFRVYGLEKRMRAGVRLGGPRKTHRLPSRCDSTRSRVYGLEKCMRAGVRLGGPEKRTGSLRVVIPPGAGFRA